MLADNRVRDKASYDDTALVELLTELAEGVGLEGTGFDGDDLDELLRETAMFFEPSPPNDQTQGRVSRPDALVRLVVQVGDIGVIERALAATGCMNRAEALAKVCVSYLGTDE
jgi:hypothetical protein